MAEQNSISTILPEFLRLFNNSVESFEKVNQAITSSRDSVTVNLQNNDGTISRVTVPSFGFLKNSVDRLDKNIQTITNLTGGDSSIRLADGTFRKLVLSKLPVEAPDLEAINSVTTFDTKSNWFFEGLINPLLYVTFDLTGQVPIDTERAIVSRYILNTNTQSKKNYFNNNYLGKADIDYTVFLNELAANNIQYVLDEAVVDLPPRDKRYFGKFSVIRISEVDVTEEVNGVSITTQKKLYKLNKINYSDSLAEFPDTIGLKVGDSLEITTEPIDTRYQVTQVDNSTNSVVLELVEGSKAVTIGADILQVASSANNTVELEVSVGFDERCVTFVKPIDPNSKLPAVNWSPGSGFFTSDLTTIDDNGTEETLATFYQQQAVDFGRFLLSFAQDKMPTSKQGLTPNAPTLTADDFRVVLINGQVTNSDAIVALQDLNNQKNTLEAELKELDTAIKQKRARIQTTNYATEVERDADRNELQGLVTDRSSKAELYASVVKEIAAKAEDNSVGSVLPKYRARGFWRLPDPRISPDTGTQDIVKFITRYRYLSSDGAANPVQEFEFQDGVGKSQGAFSNWVQLESTVRPRKKNPAGLYEWVPINDDNAEAININQLDIPVRKGEQIEVQVKSVSEAGWPSNPLESEWSNSIRIEFPADLSSDSEVERILEENQQDQARVNLEESLNEMGIQQHLSTAFTANENYYAHTSNTIASGFLSENQTPIDLFSKLVQMSNQLEQFSEILRRASGRLSVTLVDDLGNVTRLKRNTLTKVFAGFYTQEVSDLDDPRGAIVSKTFFINLADAEQTTLQLISRVTGSRRRMTKASENPAFTNAEAAAGTTILPASYPWLDNNALQQSNGRPLYETDDSDYNTMRKYDLTPIVLTNPSVPTDQPFGQDISIAPFQSAQNKGQFIFSRYKDVSSEEVFYNYINTEDNFVINLDAAENFYDRLVDTGATAVGEFIWGGGFDAGGLPTTAATYAGGSSDCLEVHTEHPYVQSLTAFAASYERATRQPGFPNGDITTIGAAPYAAAGTGNGAELVFRQSKYAPLQTDQPKGKTQNIYINENINDLSNLPGNQINLSTPGQLWPINLNAPSGVQPFTASTSLDYAGTQGVDFSRNAKTSFDPNDQYLLGERSCGSYLFLSSEDHEGLQVEGDSVQSTKPIPFGTENSLNIPLIFQYRMTDYFGQGSGSTGGGKGNVGGDDTGATVNITYAKRLGFDIYTTINDVFQFDIEVFATYKSDKLNINIFPSATVSKSLTDLEKVVSNLSPSVTETQVNQETM